MNSKKKININPNDITKIPSELILKITLKNGTKLILDEKCPMQDINKLINNNNFQNSYNNISIKNSIKLKTLEINESCLYSPLKKEILNNQNDIFNKYEENKNDTLYNNEILNKKSNNQSISDLVTEKFHKKFGNNIKEDKLPIETTINSEIKFNIKGKESKKGINNVLKDFNDLVSNFNNKKNGLINNNYLKDENKYKYYKKPNKLLLQNISGMSQNSKTIKYIGRNENNIREFNKTIYLGMNTSKSKPFYLREKKILKRNKNNNSLYLFKNKYSNEIISPPNNLRQKIKF